MRVFHFETEIAAAVMSMVLAAGCAGSKSNMSGPGVAGAGGTDTGTGGTGAGGGDNGGAGMGTAGIPANGTIVDPSVDGQIRINEFMATNVLTTRDDLGNVSGWIELYNPSTQDVPLGGYGLTDDLSAPAKAMLPAGTVIRAGGYLVLWCDGQPALGPAHVAVVLVGAGGTVALGRPDGSYIERLVYGAQEVDLSAAREPDGADKWVTEWHVSVGAANPGAGGNVPAVRAAADPPELVPAAGDLSDRVLGYDLGPQFELKISEQNIASLKASPSTWVQAMLVFEGRTYGPVGVNLKGTSSFQPIDQKPAFRVSMNKFTKGARLFGVKEILLNNLSTDPSMLHERMAYWIGRQVGGIPTSRCNNGQVTLNGTLLGLYAVVEVPKEQLMARFFADASGPVYTINYADFSSTYLPNFQLQAGKDDMAQIVGLSGALALQPADVAMAAAGQYANLHQFARYWALCVLTGHWGGWPYAPDPQPQGANAGTYADPTTRQLHFIPEGINDAFATADFDFITQAKSVLARTCAQSTSCYQDFAAQLTEILGVAERLDWATELDRLANQIRPGVMLDTKKPYTNDDVTMYQVQMRFFITGRGAYITRYLVQPGTAAIAAAP